MYILIVIQVILLISEKTMSSSMKIDHELQAYRYLYNILCVLKTMCKTLLGTNLTIRINDESDAAQYFELVGNLIDKFNEYSEGEDYIVVSLERVTDCCGIFLPKLCMNEKFDASQRSYMSAEQIQNEFMKAVEEFFEQNKLIGCTKKSLGKIERITTTGKKMYFSLVDDMNFRIYKCLEDNAKLLNLQFFIEEDDFEGLNQCQVRASLFTSTLEESGTKRQKTSK